MHENSDRLMRDFRDKYLLNCNPGGLGGVRVLDVGSMNLNGCYRRWFEGAEYVGVDMTPGPNVDCLMDGEYKFPRTLEEGPQFDVIISGQTLEHVRMPWWLVWKMAQLLKVGGLMCCIAPWSWPYHEHPIDCWRILPEGFRAIYDSGGIHMLECYMSENDTIAIGKKS